MESVALSLVSHTNVGKTTLARTLLRRDVGTVFDQAHVTEVAEAWPLIETDTASLLLWDTPGFGDTARLMARLRHEGNPLGWFLHQVWDRVRDRPLWCSQEALRNAKQDADVVLYLVNAAELPEEASYVGLELDLLAWLERPVLVLLNQTGPEDPEPLVAAWAAHLESARQVRGVFSLDAFTRCWVQEGQLLERVSELLPAAKRGAMAGLIRAWNGRNMAVLERSVAALATLLCETGADHEDLPPALTSGQGRDRAMSALVQRLERRLGAALDELIEAHGLSGRAAATVRERVADFAVTGLLPMGPKKGALWGGVLSGAAGGLTAEVLSGGLTFGAGALLGALAGALGGAGLFKGLALVKSGGTPSVRWEEGFLDGLLRRALLSYLAVAQFGRGQGEVHDELLATADSPPDGPWCGAVDASLARHRRRAGAALRLAAETGQSAWPRLASLVDVLLRETLAERYPGASGMLRAGGA